MLKGQMNSIIDEWPEHKCDHFFCLMEHFIAQNGKLAFKVSNSHYGSKKFKDSSKTHCILLIY